MTESPFNLSPYINILLKRKGLFLITALTIMSLGVIVSYVIPYKYEASCTVFIEKSVISELVKGIAITPSMDDTIKVLTTALSTRTLIHKVIGDVDFNLKARTDTEIENLVSEIQKNTDIKVAGSENFRVKFKYTDPRVARDYVNSLVRHYIEEETASRRTESYDATNFLTEQIATHKNTLAQIESEVNQYKNEKSAVINLDTGQLFREINIAQQKLFDLQLRRKQLEEEKSYVKIASEPLRQKLVLLEKRLEELRVQYTDSYPEILSITAQIEALQAEIKLHKSTPGQAIVPQDIWKLDAELKAIRENEISIQANINENRKLLASIPSSKNVLEKLEAAKATQKNMHDLLSMRSSQAEMSKQMGLKDKDTNFRVVDPAVTPVSPVSPDRKRLLLMSIAAGLAGGIGMLLLMDQLDPSIRLVDSLKPLGLPVLAVIPLIKSPEEIKAENVWTTKVFAAGGAYFAVIIAVLLMEVTGIKLVETIVAYLHLPQIFAVFFKG
jgi:polysaccharide chain length determinant protein (PEP-CTERM system associated)